MILRSVMKIGGSSMDNLEQVSGLLEDSGDRESSPVAVVSAFSGVTDQLMEISRQILKEREPFSDPNGSLRFFGQLIESTLDRARIEFKKVLPEISETMIQDELREIDLHVARQIEKMSGEIRRNFHLPHYVEDRIVGLGEIFSARVAARVCTARSRIGRVYEDVTLADILGTSAEFFTARRTPLRHPEKKPQSERMEQLFELMGDVREGVLKILKLDPESKRRRIEQKIAARIREKLLGCERRGVTPIMTGYFGYVPGGILQFAGRGYSEQTTAATAVATRLSPDVWKEGPGLMSADPRIVGARTVQLRERVSFDEAAELSGYAAMKALNARGLATLVRERISLRVRNTFEPNAPHTTITEAGDPEARGVRFVAGKKGQAIVRVQSMGMIGEEGWAYKIFKICKKLNISVDAITTSEMSISFSIEGIHPNKKPLEEALRKFGKVEITDNLAFVCCIGQGMRYQQGLLNKLTGVLSREGINIEFDCGDPDKNVTFIIADEDYEKAIRALHKELFETKSVEAA